MLSRQRRMPEDLALQQSQTLATSPPVSSTAQQRQLGRAALTCQQALSKWDVLRKPQRCIISRPL